MTKPGKGSVSLGRSWCEVSVLGSQVFGQVLMKSCALWVEHSALPCCMITYHLVNQDHMSVGATCFFL